jgi:hypothetical protein
MNKLIVAAALAGALAAPLPAEEMQPTAESSPSAAAIVADCNARKFETRVEIEKDGQKRLTKLKLCAATDTDDASWVRTLEDAKAKIAAHPDISDESKAKIGAEFDAEIAKIKSGPAASIPVPVVPAPPTTVATKSTPVTAPAKVIAKPRLSIRCLDAGESGEGRPCIDLERGTRLAIRADQDLSGSTSLRFLRRGDMKGAIALAAMRQGELIRSKLPDQLCVGVSSSKVEIQILNSNQVVETLGPYRLRC